MDNHTIFYENKNKYVKISLFFEIQVIRNWRQRRIKKSTDPLIHLIVTTNCPMIQLVGDNYYFVKIIKNKENLFERPKKTIRLTIQEEVREQDLALA